MIEKIAAVIQVDDLSAAVEAWRTVLGVPPTFVDGDRWAQFDVAGGRLALAGSDRTGAPGVMLKVTDLDAAYAAAADPGPIVDGAHERRFTIVMPDGAVAVVYQPL